MAKPNYSFEKRQRELAKKKKKEEKLKEKADRKNGLLPATSADDAEAEGADQGDELGASEASPPSA
jgi:hypothetical protein